MGNRKVTKWFSLFIAVLMLFLLAGCNSGNGGSQTDKENSSDVEPVEDKGTQEPVTISYWTNLQAPDVYTSNADMICYQVASEKTGITIEWIHPPKGQESEQFSLMIASTDLPDIIEHSWINYSGGPQAAIDTGVIQDITEEIEEYMPNYSSYLALYPELRKMVATDEGLQYNIPYIFTHTTSGSEQWGTVLEREPIPETYVGLIIRQDLLDELELERPETIDELYNVLLAFKEHGVEYPFSTTQGFLLQSQIFASAFDIVSDGFYVDGEELKYGPSESNYLEYLTVLNKFYSAGLLDPDYPAMDSTENIAKITSGKAGMWIGYYSSYLNNLYEQVLSEDPGSSFNPVGLANPLLTKGQQLKYVQADYAYRQRGAAITTSNEHVKESLTYLDWAFSEEGDKVMNWGVEGDTYVMKDGWPSLTEKVTKDEDGLGLATAIQKHTRKNGPLCMDYYNRLILGEFSRTEEGLKALDIWNSDRNGTVPASLPPITHTLAESERVAALTSEINTYVSESRTQFVMGSRPLSEFNDYIKTLESMGLSELMELKKAALDRYNAR
jgi:putative aldouronate transport system substrate-binding protein